MNGYNKNIKALITSGCSLSETISYYKEKKLATWPIYLNKYIKPEKFLSLGLGSIGNELIAKKAIHGCEQLLKNYKPEEILCAISWSGIFRHNRIVEKKSFLSEKFRGIKKKVITEEPDNMTWKYQFSNYENLVIDEEAFSIIYFNQWKDIKELDYYYGIFENQINCLENTMTQIHYIESYCVSKGINYIWTTIDNEYFCKDMTAIKTRKYMDHWSLKHLFDRLQHSPNRLKYSISNWVSINSPENMRKDYIHPDSEGHKKYFDEIMLPHLEKNGIY